jgi:hypothetical protein
MVDVRYRAAHGRLFYTVWSGQRVIKGLELGRNLKFTFSGLDLSETRNCHKDPMPEVQASNFSALPGSFSTCFEVA